MYRFIRNSIISFGLLVLVGCQTDPQATREIALLRAEILDLEDQYYALKAEHQDVVETLRAIEGGGASGTETIWMETDGDCADCDLPVGTGTVARPNPATSGFENASVHSTAQPVTRPPSNQVSAERSDRVRSDPPVSTIANQASNVMPSRSIRLPGFPVHRVVIDRRVTAGHDADNALGDEGIELAVALADDQGELTLPEGSLHVNLSAVSDDATDITTIGEWQFTRDELIDFLIRPDVPLRGFLIHLPWQSELPFENQIDVHVSWVGEDGQMLEDNKRIKIHPPVPGYHVESPAVLDWLEHDVRWMDAAEGDASERTGMPGDRNANRPAWRPVR